MPLSPELQQAALVIGQAIARYRRQRGQVSRYGLSFAQKCEAVRKAKAEMDSSKELCLSDAVRLFQTNRLDEAQSRLKKAAQYAWGSNRPRGWTTGWDATTTYARAGRQRKAKLARTGERTRYANNPADNVLREIERLTIDIDDAVRSLQKNPNANVGKLQQALRSLHQAYGHLQDAAP